MTQIEIKKLETILAKLETLQNITKDAEAKSRMLTAKNELLRIKY